VLVRCTVVYCQKRNSYCDDAWLWNTCILCNLTEKDASLTSQVAWWWTCRRWYFINLSEVNSFTYSGMHVALDKYLEVVFNAFYLDSIVYMCHLSYAVSVRKDSYLHFCLFFCMFIRSCHEENNILVSLFLSCWTSGSCSVKLWHLNHMKLIGSSAMVSVYFFIRNLFTFTLL